MSHSPAEDHVTIMPRSDVSATSLTYTVAGALDMPVARPVRSRPAYTWYGSQGSPCGVVAIKSQPSTAGRFSTIRVRLRPSQSRSTPASRHPGGVAMVVSEAAQRAANQRCSHLRGC
jgi:hypothetical protein